MTYDEIHPTLRGAVGVFEGLRKAGFESDDIFVEVAGSPGLPAGELMVFVTLKTQGKEFLVGVGKWLAAKTDELQQQWRALCAAMNGRDVPQADMDRIWQESIVYGDMVGFTLAIMNKGIEIPNLGAAPAAPPPVDVDSAQEFTVPCEFCSGTVTYPGDRKSLAHSQPPCKKFKKLDVLDFVEATNASIRRKRKESLS
jgi:hypothetical protein